MEIDKYSGSVIHMSNNNLNGVHQLRFKLQHEIYRTNREKIHNQNQRTRKITNT